jgi:hypothetical protein
MTAQTGIYDYDRMVYLAETYEANTRHFFARLDNGRMRPLTPEQAREARRAGVREEFDETRPLVAAEDGEG